MRLLRLQEGGGLSLTKDLVDNIPRYAILSHTWGDDDQEVTFHDIQHDAGQQKQGYQKLRFCAQQAASDDLQHFWVDTCCIDKSSSAELTEAINSMFRWYQNAAQCYVYLPDVSKTDHEDEEAPAWKPDFKESRWFTRGWTLQELIAPKSVTFFSAERRRLGDKASLGTLLHEITGIPIDVLQGNPLCNFGIQERYSWLGNRKTKRPEDRAYSLFGIFDIHLPLIYGEGERKAFIRLHQEVEKQKTDTVSEAGKRCIADLRVTDPRDDKRRIQDTKGGLVQDSYIWVLENPDFCQWRDNEDQQLLWVKGDPGKGKTMLLCGIIDHLEQSPADRWVSSYFFCQATDERINTATSVVRGLIFMLLDRDASLVSHLKKKHETAGKALFEDANAWQALTDILIGILQDTKLQEVCLVVDALDECIQDLPQLLDLIVQTSRFPRTKWLVSSRNWVEIEEKLCDVAHRLSLELNAKSVSAAVESYIEFKVSELTQMKGYRESTAHEVHRYLSANANYTFLWVSLVCQKLRKIRPRHTQDALESFPPGLDSLYERMMKYVIHSDDSKACREILGLVSTVYRPLSVHELQGLTPSIEAFDEDEVKEVVSSCGSFLTLRDNIVFFVHNSAKDFLLEKATNQVLSSNIQNQHSRIFIRSLDLFDNTLRRDIYNLRHPGYPSGKIKTPSPDPLSSIRYSCIYWVDHLEQIRVIAKAGMGESLIITSIMRFLSTRYLQWLEALSLMHHVQEGVKAIEKLEQVLSNSSFKELRGLAKDARRFLLSHKGSIEIAPLQTYTSALMFSPTNSLIKRLFRKEFPIWVALGPKVDKEWNACLQTLEGHSSAVNSVTFSTNGRRIASGSGDTTIKLWDVESGACLQTLEGHSDWVRSVTISTDGCRLASGSYDKTLKLWDIKSGICLQTLRGHSSSVYSVAISTSGRRIVSGSDDKTVKLWDAEAGTCLQTFQGHSFSVNFVAISFNNRRIASCSDDTTIKLWDVESGACLRTLTGHSSSVYSVAISTNGRKIASSSDDKTVKLWDAEAGTCLQTLQGHSSTVYSIAISTDCRRIASGSYDTTIKLWDAESGACLQTLKGNSSSVHSVAISTDGRMIASGSNDTTIKLWDVESSARACLQTFDSHSSLVHSIAISTDGRRLASGSDDKTVKLWDVESSVCLRTFEGHSSLVYLVAISADGRRIASGSFDKTVKLWDAESGACLQTLNIGRSMRYILFDPRHHSRLLSDTGNIELDPSSIVYASLTPITAPNDYSYDKYSISTDSVWITQNGDNLIWLPAEYRPSDSAVTRSTIAIGCKSGRVWTIRLAETMNKWPSTINTRF